MTTNLPTTAKQQFDLSPQTFDQALTLANYLAESDLVPKDFKGKPGNCLIAMQWGAELGLKPMQAMQNIAVINGRPALWGDAVIALVLGSPVCEHVTESDDGETATCKVKRRGHPEQTRTFSTDDARRAGLAGKAGPWSQYPGRMRQMRARAFALRDVFPDVLKGIAVAEELQDMPPPPAEKFMGAADVVPQHAAAIELAPYPNADFDRNIAAWAKAISSGTATADAVIAKVSTKGALTAEQRKRIQDLEKPTAAPVSDATPATPIPADAVRQALESATGLDELHRAAEQIDQAAESSRDELTALYERRQNELPF